MVAPTKLIREPGYILSWLADLSWKVVRLHYSPRGGLIVTALKNGRVATVELPRAIPREAHVAWMNGLDSLFARAAYDPTDTTPPVLTLALSDDLAELVPDGSIDSRHRLR